MTPIAWGSDCLRARDSPLIGPPQPGSKALAANSPVPIDYGSRTCRARQSPCEKIAAHRDIDEHVRVVTRVPCHGWLKLKRRPSLIRTGPIRPSFARGCFQSLRSTVIACSLIAAAINRAVISSEATFYRWKQLYGGLLPSEVKKLRQLEGVNTQPRRMVADLTLDKERLQEVIRKL
jgi:putative transposase